MSLFIIIKTQKKVEKLKSIVNIISKKPFVVFTLIHTQVEMYIKPY